MVETAFAWAKWAEGLRPEPLLTVSEWAERFRLLPNLSAEPGRWRNDRTPYLVGVMDALSPSCPVERVVFMKGAQIGATEAGNNWLGYIIHNAPGLVLSVMPSLDDVKRNSATRIDPLIEGTPALKERVSPANSRESGNSMFRKKFLGGELVLTGATSPKGLRSTPARYLFLDEIDGYPADADGEGDPIALAVQRTVTFRARRKIYMVSTPTLKGYSRIEKAYLESDQRVFEVPCRECGAYSRIVWANIHWPEGERTAAYWGCPECGGIHEEHHKPALLAGGRWRATAQGDGKTAGFHLSALYSPFEPWGDIAVEHGQVKKDPVRLKAWVNLKLGETWEEADGEGATAEGLPARAEDLSGPLPAWVATLTAGVDVQPDRLEATVWAWGAGERSAVLSHTILWGDPTSPQVWIDLENMLCRTYPHVRAVPDLPIRAVAVDTGGIATMSTYAWLRGKERRRWWGIKGSSTPGAPLWPRKPSRNNKGKIALFIVGTGTGKETIYARLKNETPGPGHISFSDTLTEQYYQQLTAEKVRTKYSKGHPIREWYLPDGKRCEALDCAVYALAALHGLYAMGVNLDRESEALSHAPMKSLLPENAPEPAHIPRIFFKKSQYARR